MLWRVYCFLVGRDPRGGFAFITFDRPYERIGRSQRLGAYFYARYWWMVALRVMFGTKAFTIRITSPDWSWIRRVPPDQSGRSFDDDVVAYRRRTKAQS